MTVWNFGSHYNFRPQKRACLTQALFIGVTPHKLHIHSRTTPFKNCILYLQQEKPRHDRRGDFMKYQKKMIVPALALAMLLCGTMTAFAANANPANAENLREEGESAIVWDVTEQPSPENDKNEYWAYDEYKAYAESIERSLMELLATGEPDLTQQDVQACKDTLARTLDFIKNGGHVSKNMVNGDSFLMVSPLDSSLVGSFSEK